TRVASPLSSVLARSISYLISWDTSLAASATRSPSDWSPAGPGVSLWTIGAHLPRVRTAIRAPARLRAPASDCSSGAPAHVRQSPRLALSAGNMGAPRQVRRFSRCRGGGELTGRAAGPEGRLEFRFRSHVAFTP